MIFPVTDPDDPRIEGYRAVRERDLVGRQGLFVAEGRVVLEKLASDGRRRVRSVLIAEPRLAGMGEVLARLGDETPIYAASQAVMDAIVGFPIHRGVLALGERQQSVPDEVLGALPENALVLALCGIANHDNMGGLFRNAAAFGVDAVVLDSACCDPLYRKAIRVSVGAVLTTPFVQLAPGVDMVDRLREAGCDVVALSPRGDIDLQALRRKGPMAVLFGAEGPGLPQSVLERSRTVRIRMAGDFDSLNVATTSGIVLHHLASLADS